MRALTGEVCLLHKDVEFLLGLDEFRFSPDIDFILPYGYWTSGHVNSVVSQVTNPVENIIWNA